MWDIILNEIRPKFGPDMSILLMRLTGAAVLCSVIGWERELKTQTAGLRTNILVGVAAAAFALITLAMMDLPMAQADTVRTDPIRLIEAVTNGVAFLAAGIVVFSKGEVHGLTTGASMWLAAAIGLSVGLGFWLIAVLATVIGLVVLNGLRHLQTRLGVKEKKKNQLAD